MKFDDLEIGMMINQGLITFLRKAHSNTPMWGETGESMDSYWEDKNVVACFMLEDGYIGQGVQTYGEDDEFTEMFERGSSAYTDAIARLMRERQGAADDALADVLTLQTILLEHIPDDSGG